MPIINPFRGLKKVIFSYTPPWNNVICDESFTCSSIISTHITLTLEVFVDKQFTLNNNMDSILRYYPYLEIDKYNKVVFNFKDTELNKNKPFYDRVKDEDTIIIETRPTKAYWKLRKVPCVAPPPKYTVEDWKNDFIDRFPLKH